MSTTSEATSTPSREEGGGETGVSTMGGKGLGTRMSVTISGTLLSIKITSGPTLEGSMTGVCREAERGIQMPAGTVGEGVCVEDGERVEETVKEGEPLAVGEPEDEGEGVGVRDAVGDCEGVGVREEDHEREGVLVIVTEGVRVREEEEEGVLEGEEVGVADEVLVEDEVLVGVIEELLVGVTVAEELLVEVLVAELVDVAVAVGVELDDTLGEVEGEAVSLQ